MEKELQEKELQEQLKAQLARVYEILHREQKEIPAEFEETFFDNIEDLFC